MNKPDNDSEPKDFVIQPTTEATFTHLNFEAQYRILLGPDRCVSLDPQAETVFQGEQGCWLCYEIHKSQDFRLLTMAQAVTLLNTNLPSYPVRITEIETIIQRAQ
jgi:hypothetical protein